MAWIAPRANPPARRDSPFGPARERVRRRRSSCRTSVRAPPACHDALLAAADAIRAGKIVAVKGVGGFQLLVDARDERAVVRLRDRKRRPDKPFALLFPSLDSVESACEVSDLEASLLISPRSPIVLLRARRGASSVCPSVAPGNPWLGAMLPPSPPHHLLARERAFPP